MNQSRRRFLTVAAAATLSGSTHATPITRQRFRALGTVAELTLVGKPHLAQAALRACRVEVTKIETAFSLYQPDSTLSQLNRHGSVATDWRFAALLRHALDMAKATEGSFDPTIQPLWRALATGDDLARARRHIGWRHLQLAPRLARFTQPQMAASFNGIAQGYAADRVSTILAEHGFKNALVNLGEFAARGAKPNDAWQLGIGDPSSGRIVVKLTPMGAIATSEPRGTLILGQPHIIDPLNRRGERWASVTVEAAEAWRADALSTAIAAAPLQQATSLLKTGGATRGWMIDNHGALQQWRA